MTNQDKHADYDEEPVEYCSKCYSLKIKHIDAVNLDCCMDCGSTETATASISDWERMYEHRYGHKFLKRHNDPRDSVWFRMPVYKLKAHVYRSPKLNDIIHKLYPHFPEGYTNSEKVLLLFDALTKDGRMDDLRRVLWEMKKIES